MSRPGFRSVVRTRVLERIAQACAYPVALIVAPAGYGKSVALRQYLDTLSEPYVRFDVRPEHATLPAFIRAFAESLSGVAPHMVASLPDALRGAPSAEELAAWFNAQLQDYHGLVVVDDLQFAPAVEAPQFLRTAIDVTKDRMRWLIATRSVPDLPIASWITYGDMDLAVDEHDLAFTVDEVRDASLGTGAHDDELRRFVEMTNGWATALNFALRMRLRTSELAAIGATTREMVYRYLAEQVYDHLSDSEREILHLAAFLPTIDVDLLIQAGYPKALDTLERLRKSAAFLSIEANRRYRCHDLFRDFLQFRVSLAGREAVNAIQERAAELLFTAQRGSEALRIYVALRSEVKLLEILARRGFELIDNCDHESVDAAIAALSPQVRSRDCVILALRGIRESEHGRFSRAELLLRKSISIAEQPLKTEVTLRLARVLNNQDRDITVLLEELPLETLPTETQGRILSYLALSYARQGRADDALCSVDRAKAVIEGVESTATRAQILHRLAVAAFELDASSESVRQLFAEAYAIASQEGRFFTAAASAGGLGVVAMLYDDDLSGYKAYTELFLDAARKSGDRGTILGAISRLLHVEVQIGNIQKAKILLDDARRCSSPEHYQTNYISKSAAIVFAAERNFKRAFEQSSDHQAYYSFDRVYSTAMRAVFAVGCGLREQALSIVASNLGRFQNETFPYAYGKRRAELAKLLCAMVEALVGRSTAARRILRSRPLGAGPAVDALRSAVQRVVDTGEPLEALEYLEVLRNGDYAEIALVLEALVRSIGSTAPGRSSVTDAERDILCALDAGRSPKEIAAETGRSIHTVRTLIQRATEKLGCSGRQQAIAEARRQGLLTHTRRGNTEVVSMMGSR